MPFQPGNQEAKKKGKHKKTLAAEALRAQLEERITKEFKPLMDAKVALGTGHKVMMVKKLVQDKTTKKWERTGAWQQVTDPDTVEKLLNGDCSGNDYYQIWTKSPESRSSEYLIDQVIGRPMERAKVEAELLLEIDF